MIKYFLSLMIFVPALAFGQSTHEEFGQDSSFFKIIEAAQSRHMNELIYSFLENDPVLSLKSVGLAEKQPDCAGKTRIEIKFKAESQICTAYAFMGECGKHNREIVRTSDNDFSCE